MSYSSGPPLAKPLMFDPTPPALINVLKTTKSYIVLFTLVQALAHRNPDSIVELVFLARLGILPDVVLWCSETGNRLLSTEMFDDKCKTRCLIQKGTLEMHEKARTDKKMCTIVLATADLESVLPILERGLGVAVLGWEVNVVVEGAGVKLLRTGYRTYVSGWWKRLRTSTMERFVKCKVGGVLPYEVIEMLEDVGAKFWVDGSSLGLWERIGEEKLIKKFETIQEITTIELCRKSDVYLSSVMRLEKP